MKNIRFEKLKDIKKITEKIYFGYCFRLFTSTFLFLIFLALTALSIVKLCNINQPAYIDYSENSNLDYKVYLKENKFYDSDYLGKGMLYVTSLIDKISIDFNYNLKFNEKIDMNLKYDIIAKLNIKDKDGTNTYFTKEYTLLKNQNVNSTNTTNHLIKENIVIDYGYYNNIASNFKSSYNLDTESNLIIYLNINRQNNDNNYKFEMGEPRIMYINIPLSEKSVNISMDYKNIENNLKVLNETNNYLYDLIYLLLIAIGFVFSFIFLTKIIKLSIACIARKSNYEKHLNKILKEYDRVIVETTTVPVFNPNKTVKVNKFEELLDVRDNLRLPIMHYVVIKKQKSYFYVKHYNDIYLLVLKAADFDEK